MTASIVANDIPSKERFQYLLEAGKMPRAIRSEEHLESAIDLTLLGDVQRELALE